MFNKNNKLENPINEISAVKNRLIEEQKQGKGTILHNTIISIANKMENLEEERN